MPLNLSRNEAERILLNIERSGGDAGPLRAALDDLSKKTNRKGHPDNLSDEDYVKQLREKSPVEKGPSLKCILCAKPSAELISGTCPICFTEWALSTRKRR